MNGSYKFLYNEWVRRLAPGINFEVTRCDVSAGLYDALRVDIREKFPLHYHEFFNGGVIQVTSPEQEWAVNDVTFKEEPVEEVQDVIFD